MKYRIRVEFDLETAEGALELVQAMFAEEADWPVDIYRPVPAPKARRLWCGDRQPLRKESSRDVPIILKRCRTAILFLNRGLYHD